ncbi:MAG: hypothetical protein EOM50_12215 [Erysipelotrichia bacterium]|nr:hypothetical protein [Erysipelotrichia bacterium]
MGRYYTGDINGKFWFGVQSSDAADRFGVKGYEPSYLEYYFTKDDLQAVQDELKDMESLYKDKFEKIEEYFKIHNSYTDDIMAEDLGWEKEQVRHYLSEYADYELGKKIEACIIKNGECEFTAEC